MLYTLSQAYYDQTELHTYLAYLNAQDAVVLWQDGVLAALKYADVWQNLPCDIFVLDIDVQARGIQHLISDNRFQSISLCQLVKITENFSPQLAL
ncbi:MAG: sulfurtransferase complex subunit TusB [Lonepinella koalarum]|nr:sulfurtransferase complex subunit TusB [Lonepinella koalarum]